MKWTVGASRTLHDCPWFRLDQTDVTLPDGRTLAHHVIRTPAPVVAVLAVDEQDRILLLHRHRFITDRAGWELPAGAADPDEDPAAAAARELAEEPASPAPSSRSSAAPTSATVSPTSTS